MMWLNRPLYEAMLAHVQAAYPLEACGLLAGQASQATHLYPIDNILHSPTAYEMDPVQQVKTLIEIEEKDWSLVAIYHSHPHGPPIPSASDIALAYYPEAVQLIISLQDPAWPVTRAFTIVNGAVNELPLLVQYGQADSSLRSERHVSELS
jgi:proteasome lid subunit RPN8/RPN11